MRWWFGNIYLYIRAYITPDTDKIISQVLKSELPAFVKGKTGYAKSGQINIWYEAIEPEGTPKGTILLLMGISNDAMAWPPKFLDALVGAGKILRHFQQIE